MKQLFAVFFMVLVVMTSGTSAIADSGACIDECNKCKSVCEKTLKHCNQMGVEHGQADHIKCLQDCITLCKDTADFISRDSGLIKQLATVCSQACIRCADSCKKAGDDKMMRKCAQECTNCAEALKAYAAPNASWTDVTPVHHGAGR